MLLPQPPDECQWACFIHLQSLKSVKAWDLLYICTFASNQIWCSVSPSLSQTWPSAKALGINVDRTQLRTLVLEIIQTPRLPCICCGYSPGDIMETIKNLSVSFLLWWHNICVMLVLRRVHTPPHPHTVPKVCLLKSRDKYERVS